MTFTHELILAKRIDVPPTPANPSRITLAPLHLFAIKSETCSGGVRAQEL